jgi:WD40 repeat protein
MLSQKPFPNEKANQTQGFRRHGNSSHASVQAVEWLSSDVIASGLRNSTVFLYDVRTGDTSLRLQHSQSVTKIRKVDPWRIVVGGHNSVSFRALHVPVLVSRSRHIRLKCTTSGSWPRASNTSPNP